MTKITHTSQPPAPEPLKPIGPPAESDMDRPWTAAPEQPVSALCLGQPNCDFPLGDRHSLQCWIHQAELLRHEIAALKEENERLRNDKLPK
jgi:hypothetical protein